MNNQRRMLFDAIAVSLFHQKNFDFYMKRKNVRIIFSLHQIDNYEKQVSEMANENAKEKDEEIASGFGVKIKKVLYVEESAFGKNYPNPFNPSMTNDRILQEISTAGLHSKPIKLTNRIKVVFEIE